MCVAAFARRKAPRVAEYWQFYKNRVAAGDTVILDNGAYEGELVDPREYATMIAELVPTAYVVPDVIGDFRASSKLGTEFTQFTASQRIEVFQGQTREQLYDFCTEAQKRTNWIALSKRSGGSRAVWAETIRMYHPGLKIHALGFIDENPLDEIRALAKLGVGSIDSSEPVWKGLMGRKVGVTYKGRFADYVHAPIAFYDATQANENIDEVFQLAGARECNTSVQITQATTRVEREVTRPRYDLIPKSWLDTIAGIFEEGARKYGENNWKDKSPAFYQDCINHAWDHLLRYQEGDHSEAQLAKVAWNVLAKDWWDKKQKEEKKQDANK